MSDEAALDEVQRAARDQFAKQSGNYGKGHILEDVSDVAEAASVIELPEGARVLDLATGGGHTGLYFAAQGYTVTLADLAEPMLERASQLAQERNLSVEVRAHSAEELPYPDQSFDLVTCRVAAHHFSSPEKFLGEASRVLNPRGWFLLIDGTVEDDQPEAEAWLHKVEKARDPSHHRFISPRTWAQMCERHGMRVVSSLLTPLKQPDLEWYFNTAGTNPENRQRVREMIEHAPESARRLFSIGEEDGKIIWWWQRLTLVARKV